MTLLWVVARAGVVVAVMGAAALLLPAADAYDNSALTIPDVLWNPLVGVLSLNRYLPIQELLVLAALTVGIQAGMAGFWIASFVLRKVLG